MASAKQTKDEASTAQDKIDFGLLNRHIHFLVGDIVEENTTNAIKWIIYENAVNPDAHLTLYINSIGGNVPDALALIDTIRNSNCTISTVGLGSILSCGFFIFVAGHKGHRYISKNTSILTHQFSDTMTGKFHDLNAYAKELERSDHRLVQLLQDASGLDEATIKRKLLPPSDVWLTPEELIKYNVADHII